MFCSKCGNEIDNNAIICPFCGCETENYAPSGQISDDVMKNDSISKAKTFGIISIILGFFLPMIGLIFGIIGKVKAGSAFLDTNDEEVKKVKKLNTIGIIIAIAVGVIGIIYNIVSMIAYKGNTYYF
ncbi:MAG: zinc ribbon domain-containing protein [Clostridia bacterium]|nr:zinc ribbon domain-containing protein [Clostridia bacterium]